MKIDRQHKIQKSDQEKEVNSYLALQDVRQSENRYRSYLLRIKTIMINNDYHYSVILTWGRIGNKKRVLSYLCNNMPEVDRLLKPVLRTRLRHGYQIIDKGEHFPKYEILDRFEKGEMINSLQLSFAF